MAIALRQIPKKEREALAFLREQLPKDSKPIVLFSSGKDSLVALHLTLRLRQVPVMWWRLPQFQEKQAHGNWVVKLWGLAVHDMLPTMVQEFQHEEFFEVFHGYGVDQTGMIFMSTGVVRYPDTEKETPAHFLCAVEDLLLRPKGLAEWPWTHTIQGHKSSDEGYLAASVTITEPAQPFGATMLLNPLHDWTDKDIWGYIKRYDLPYDTRRYRQHNHAVSPDHYTTCFRCLDGRDRGKPVLCPTRGEMIHSIAKSPQDHRQFLHVMRGMVRHVAHQGPPRATMGEHI